MGQEGVPHKLKEGDTVYMQIPKPRFGYTKASPRWKGPYTLGQGNSTTFKLFDRDGRPAGHANVKRSG